MSVADCRDRKYKPPAIKRATNTPTPAIRILKDLFGAATGLTVDALAEAALPEAEGAAATGDEADAGAASEAGRTADAEVTCAAIGACASCATGTESELWATARPLSVSRFNLCKSARISAAC